MKKFRFLYIAAAALLFAACANEEDGIGNNGPVAATVKADISNNIKTRGTADNDSWTAGDAIGVYVTSYSYTTGDNKKYVTTNGDGTFEAADTAGESVITTSSISRTTKRQHLVHTILIANP